MQKYGPISKIWIGFELSVVLQDLNDVEVCIANYKQSKCSNSIHRIQLPLTSTPSFANFIHSQIVLTNSRYIEKSSHYNFLKAWLTDGLFYYKLHYDQLY